MRGRIPIVPARPEPAAGAQIDAPGVDEVALVEPRALAGVPREIAVLPLRDAVLFPSTLLTVTIGRPKSIRLLEAEMAAGRPVGVVAQVRADVEEPGLVELHPVGTTARVTRMVRRPDGRVRVSLEGTRRFRMQSLVRADPYLQAAVEEMPDAITDATLAEALRRKVGEQFLRLFSEGRDLPRDTAGAVESIEDPVGVVSLVMMSLHLPMAEKQALLEVSPVEEQLRRLVTILDRETGFAEIGAKVEQEARGELERHGREAFLREQIRALRRELGEEEEVPASLRDLAKRIDEGSLPEEAAAAARAEMRRLESMSPLSPDAVISRNYIDWILALPWSDTTPDRLDIGAARGVLDEDHEGLASIKERILEHIAVLTLRKDTKAPVLCFTGPPGVGKTSLARSIARALGRRFVRLALGGVRDEAEIRGHRRTYVGALPGRILQGLRRAGTGNPVFLLDEIDKMGSDWRGDPAAALLEVLDPEQNRTFSDHYLELPFDLSRVLFVATANFADTLPPALLDRLDVITLGGYTEEEKVAIAQRHLLPRQIRDHGLEEGSLKLGAGLLRVLVRDHTREAGVRNLDRALATLCRKAARERVEKGTMPARLDAALLRAWLGAPRYRDDPRERTSVPGVAIGLAWTPAGGKVLFVEASRMEGRGRLILTGQLGDVMKESARIALSWMRHRAERFGILPSVIARDDVHLHVPAGAVPKDGPSAGVALAAALVSLYTRDPVRPDVAMTGEITLRGRVMPVGGIKEKVLGAIRTGIRTVILPARNSPDLEDIDPAQRRKVEIRLVHTLDQVLDHVLKSRAPTPRVPAAPPAVVKPVPSVPDARASLPSPGLVAGSATSGPDAEPGDP